MIKLEIPGIPISWRAHAGSGRRSFNPLYKEREMIQWYVKNQTSVFLEGALHIDYEFHLPIPKSFSKKKRRAAIEGVLPHISKKDCTNMQKFFEDCIKGILFEDDAQVISGSFKKLYSENPHTIITVSEVKF